MLEAIRRKLSSLGKKKGSAVQNCPLQKGIVCVVVNREGTNDPIKGVAVKVAGPTGGQQNSDDLGIAQFDDRDPGAYELTLTFPNNLQHFNYTDGRAVATPWTGGVAVAGGEIRIVELFARPTGTLEVKTFLEDRQKNRTPLTQVQEIYSKTGPDALREAGKNTHTFQRVACGKYSIAVRMNDDRFDPVDLSKADVVVPEGGKAVAEIVMSRKAWIKFVVSDEDEKKSVDGVRIKLKRLDGSIAQLSATRTTPAEEWMKNGAGTCAIEELDMDGDDLYEVLTVETS